MRVGEKILSKIQHEHIKKIPDVLIGELKKNNISESDALYFFDYNYDKNQKLTDGCVVITKDFLFLHDEASGVRKYPYEQLTEIKCNVNITNVALECKKDGEYYELCKGSLEYQNEFLSIAGQLEKFRLDKSFEITGSQEMIRCPKCGGYFERGTEFCVNCQDKVKTLKRTLALVLPYKKFIVVSIVVFFAISAIQLIVPYLQRILIDEYIYPPLVSAGLASNYTTFYQLLTIILGLIAMQIVIRGLWIVRNLVMTKVSAELSHNLRAMIFEKVQQLSISRISKRTSGELINRITNDTGTLNDFLTYMVPDIIQQAMILLVVTVYMVYYNWQLALLIFIPAPLFIISFRVTWGYMRTLFNKSWMKGSKASGILHDIFSGIRVVKIFGTEKQEIKKYNKAIKEQADIQQKSEIFFNFLNPINWFLFSIGSYLILYFISNKIIHGEMTIGQMNQLNNYIGLIYGPLSFATWLPRRITYVLTSIGKLFEVIDEKVDVETKDNAVVRDVTGYIDIKNVAFGYKKHEMVLKEVNLSVKPGEMIGIVGKSGVGKSTLINLIMRLYDVNEGSIKIDGLDIRDYDPTSYRSQIGVVLQETFLFSGTIYENIAYSKPGCTKDEVMQAAKLANAHQFIVKLPASYNTKLGENGHNLSGGERQRIAIARAILHDPKILILDEATSALDTETEALIQDSLQKLIQNRTTFAIAHRLATLRNATRLIILDKGTIAEVGTHDELMKEKGIYYSLVMAQRQMSKMAIAKDS